MATIPNVADNGLILTTWGNAVADELNVRTLKNNANGATSGTLTASQMIVTAAAPTAADHLTRKDYVDSATVSIGGDSMTGALLLPLSQSANGQAAIHRQYAHDSFVEVNGDTMAGTLNVGAAPTASLAGSTVRTDGNISSTVTSGATPQALPNIVCQRTGTNPQNVDGRFIEFRRTSAGTPIGWIDIASASSVAFNETSDRRLKQPTGDVADAADIVHDLGALVYRGRWIADQGLGKEWVFLNSQDVETVAPYAVSGDGTAVDGDGKPIPQGLDHGALVPLLFAALSQALDRIDALEAALP